VRQLPIRRAMLDSESRLLGCCRKLVVGVRALSARIRHAPGHFSAAILLPDY
jgi:hypothetical protein